MQTKITESRRKLPFIHCLCQISHTYTPACGFCLDWIVKKYIAPETLLPAQCVIETYLISVCCGYASTQISSRRRKSHPTRNVIAFRRRGFYASPPFDRLDLNCKILIDFECIRHLSYWSSLCFRVFPPTFV